MTVHVNYFKSQAPRNDSVLKVFISRSLRGVLRQQDDEAILTSRFRFHEFTPTGLVSGMYPALVLSSFNPVKVIKPLPEDAMQGSGFINSDAICVKKI